MLCLINRRVRREVLMLEKELPLQDASSCSEIMAKGVARLDNPACKAKSANLQSSEGADPEPTASRKG
jgi:hypothetical protein